MKRAIDEEVRLTRTKEEYEKYNKNELPAHANGLTIAYDMGWNKRSSGNRYDSVLGHGVVIGVRSKKVLCFKPKSKDCLFCKSWKKKVRVMCQHILAQRTMKV